MGFFKNLFGGEKRDTSYDMLVRKIIELETLFSGDILENPRSVAIDAEGYKGMCYARCKQYQEKIGKVHQEIEGLLEKNDGSISSEKEQRIRRFIAEMLECVRNAAEEFFQILDRGDGESKEVKEKLNEESYQHSVVMRQQFREQIKDVRNLL